MRLKLIYNKKSMVLNINFFIIVSLFLLMVLPITAPAGEPFSITEISTDYGIAENTITLEVINNINKNQYITDISEVFSDHSLTDKIEIKEVLLFQDYQSDVYGYLNESQGKYKTVEVVEECTGNKTNETCVDVTYYYDNKDALLTCDFVDDKEYCFKSVYGITGQETKQGFLSLPILKEKIKIDGVKIKQKQSGLSIPLPKSGTIKLKITYSHPLAYQLEVPENVNKYDIEITTADGTVVLDPEWWSSDWDYNKEISITNTLVSTTNYQVKVDTDTKTPYDAGKLNTTCQDIRFVNSTGFELSHWAENCNITGNSTFWVNVTSIPKDVTTTIYMYYGNEEATYNNTIGGKKTFLVFADFNDGTTDGYVTDAGTYDNPDDYLRADVSVSIGHIGIQCSNCSATADIRSGTVQEMGIIARYNDPDNDAKFYLWRIQSTTVCQLYINPYVLLDDCAGTYAVDTWYELELAMYGSNLTGFIDGVQKVSVIENTYSIGYVGFLSNINADRHYDNLRVRNYINPEPTISIGAEETEVIPNTAPSITASATSPSTVYSNTDFKLNLTITDPEADTITGYVQFYINGSSSGAEQSTSPVTNNTNTLIGTLANANFGVSYTLIAEYWAGDGTANTTKVNATTETVYTTMGGTVKDSDSVVVNNAKVIIINQATNTITTTTDSNATGGWTYDIAVVGTYLVVAYDPNNSTRDGDADPHIIVS